MTFLINSWGLCLAKSANLARHIIFLFGELFFQRTIKKHRKRGKLYFKKSTPASKLWIKVGRAKRMRRYIWLLNSLGPQALWKLLDLVAIKLYRLKLGALLKLIYFGVLPRRNFPGDMFETVVFSLKMYRRFYLFYPTFLLE